MNKIKFGIAGVGRMGSIHLENLVTKFQDAEVVAISDINPNTNALAQQFGVSKVYIQFEDLVNDKEVEAVVICSPTDFHANHIILAAKAGKQIFCEKPMDLSLETVKEVLDIVEEAGVKLMIAFNRRFDPNFTKVQQMVSQGKVGKPLVVKITSRDPGPPPISYIKSSGGLFLDMAIHDFDMARFVVNQEVEEVYATGAVFVDPEIGKAGDIDTAVTTLTFKNGTIAVIDNCRKAAYGYDQRLEVLGESGMCGSENKLHDNHFYYDANGIHGALPLDFFMDRYADSYFNEMKAFIECLKVDKTPPTTGHDGIMSLAIGLAAKKSLQENRVVKLSEIL
ncbi:inositol 2-dehydrogenase [Mariniflexile sp.]|uniref:inositol 2-dehydrogenase n=1 Tax=Mariniflexile sp. TaxID=1979402 RepID=UPI004048702A